MNTENFTLICRIAELLDKLDDQLDRTGDVGRMGSAQQALDLGSEELMSRGETGHDGSRHGTLGRTLTMSRLNQGAQSRVFASGVLGGRGFADKVTTTSIDLERRHSVGSDILREDSNLGKLEALLKGELELARSHSSAPIAPLSIPGRAAGEFVRHESEIRGWSEMDPCEEEEMVDLEMGFGRDHKIRWAKGCSSPSFSVLSSDLEYSETSSAHESVTSEINFEAETVASKLASDPELLRNLLTKVVELLDYEFPAKLTSLARNYKETEQNYTRLNDRYEALTCETDEQHQEIVKLQASVDSLASQLRDALEQNVQLKAAASQVKTYKDQIQEIESEKQVEIDRVRKETRKQTVRLIKSGFGVGDVESRRASRKGTMEPPSFSNSPSRSMSMKFPSASPRKRKSVNVVEPGALARVSIVQNHDVDILQNRISALEDEKNTQAQLLQTSIEILKSENSSLKTAVESLEAEVMKVESLKAEKTQADSELTQKTLAIEQLIQELSEFEDQMDQAKKEKRFLLEELENSEQIRLMCAESYEKIKAKRASARLPNLIMEIEFRKANVDRLRLAVTRCDELIAAKTKYIEFIKDQVTSQAADLTKLHEVSAGLMLDTGVIKAQLNKLKDLNGELNREVESLREDIGSRGAENQGELQRENKRLVEENNTLSGINVSLVQKNKEIKESLDKEIARLTVEVENRQVDIVTLEELVRMKDQMLAAAMKRNDTLTMDFDCFKVETDLNNRRLMEQSNDQMRVVESISEERDNFRNALETITAQIAVGNDQLKQALSDKGIADAKIREFQQQITLVENGKHQLLEEIGAANAQVSELMDSNLKLRQRSDGLSSELKQFIHAAEASRRDLETMNARLQSLSDQNKQLSDSLSAANNSGFEKDLVIGEAQSRIQIQAKIEANYKRNYSALLRELDIYKAKIGNLETKFETAETTNIELKSQVDLLTSQKLESQKSLSILGLENKVLEKKLSTIEKFENSTQTSSVAHEASAAEIARLKILVNHLQHQRPADIQIVELRARIKYLTNAIAELQQQLNRKSHKSLPCDILQSCCSRRETEPKSAFVSLPMQQQLNRKSHKSLPCDILQTCCSLRETEPKSAFVSLPSSPARYRESPSVSDLATVLNPVFEPKLRPVANFGRSPPSVEFNLVEKKVQTTIHEMMPNQQSVEPLSRMRQKTEDFSIKTPQEIRRSSVPENQCQTRDEIYKCHPRSTQNSRTTASYSLPRTVQPCPNNGKTAELALPPAAPYELSRPIVSSQQSPNTRLPHAMPDRYVSRSDEIIREIPRTPNVQLSLSDETISKPTLPYASRPSVPASLPYASRPSVPASLPYASRPSVPATLPSVPATLPSVPDSRPSVPATLPSVPASRPSVPATRPSVPERNQITAEHTIGDVKLFEQATSAAPGGVSKGPARRLPHSRIPSRVLYVEPFPQPEVVPKRPRVIEEGYVKPEPIYDLEKGEKIDLSYEHPSPRREWVKKEEPEICRTHVAPEPRRDNAETPTFFSEDEGASPIDKGTVKKTVSRLEQAAEAYQERVRKQRLALAATKMSPAAHEDTPHSFERLIIARTAEFDAIKRQRQLGYQPCTSERLPAHFPRVLHDPATGHFMSPTELRCQKGVNGAKVPPNVKQGQIYVPPKQVSRPVDQQSGRLPVQCGGEPVIRDFIDSQGFIHRGFYDKNKQIRIQNLDPRCRALSSPFSGQPSHVVPRQPSSHVDTRQYRDPRQPSSHVDPRQNRDPRQPSNVDPRQPSNVDPRQNRDSRPPPNPSQYSYLKSTQIASSMEQRNGSFSYPNGPTRYPEQQQIVQNRGYFQQSQPMMEQPGSKFVDEQTMTNRANQFTESEFRQAPIVPPLRLDEVKRPNLDEEPPMFFPPGGLLGQLGSLVRRWMG